MQAIAILQGASTVTTTTHREEIPDEGQAFMARLKTEVIPWIERSTVPFFHLRKDPRKNEYGIAGKDRSGVQLRIGNDHLILTAAHFLEDYIQDGIFIFMSWDDEEKCPIPIT
jgi:hypothetical protein